MKTIKYLLLGLVFVLSACNKFVTSVDEVDPTKPTDADLELVVTAGQVGYIGYLEGEVARNAGIMSGQFTGADRQLIGYQNYNYTAPDFSASWGNLYANVIKSFQIASNKAEAGNNLVTLGMLQVLQGHSLGMAASLWGDIPYTEAINIEAYPNPKFDDQAEVYASAQKLIADGIDNLSSGTGSIVGDVFNLDASQWISVAHTISAKLYLHTGDYAQAMSQALLGISDPNDDLSAPHGTGYGQNFNVWYSFLVYDRAGYMGAKTSLSAALLDPGYFDDDVSANRYNAKTNEGLRYAYYFQPFEVYAPDGHEPNYFSSYDWGYGDGFFGTETSYPLVSYAENNLILAECFLRTTNDFTNSLAYLNIHRNYLASGDWYPGETWNEVFGEGLTSLYDPYVAADFAPGGMENLDNIADMDALYREIIEEKYISLTGQIEVFNDVRRKGYGMYSSVQNWQVIGIIPNTGSKIPQRFLIPQSEIDSNENAPHQGADELFTELPIFK